MKTYNYKIQGVDYEVNIDDVEGNIAKVTVNGKEFEVEMNHPLRPTQKSVKRPVAAAVAPATANQAPAAAAAPVNAAPATGKGVKVNSPLPGTITSVNVAVGQAVKAGDVVIVLEAMKMQNNIEAENSGTVTSILVNKGDSVMEGTTLLTIG
jgi:biotin carboxyl carrier protein